MVAFFSVFYLCRLLDVLRNAYDFIATDTFADYVTCTRYVCVGRVVMIRFYVLNRSGVWMLCRCQR